MVFRNKQEVAIDRLFLPDYDSKSFSFFEAYQFTMQGKFSDRQDLKDYRFSPLDIFTRKSLNLQYAVDKPSRVRVIVMDNGVYLLDTIAKLDNSIFNHSVQSSPLAIWGNHSIAYFFNLDRPMYSLLSGGNEFIPGWKAHLSMRVIVDLTVMESCNLSPIEGIKGDRCSNGIEREADLSSQICITSLSKGARLYWSDSLRICRYSDISPNLRYALPSSALIIWLQGSSEFADKAFLRK
jgi:hypothetical protein